MVKTIKISDENYVWLTKYAGKIQTNTGQPISIDAALSYVKKSRELSTLAGAWKLPEKEVKKTTTVITDRLKAWPLRYLHKKEEQKK